MERGRRSWSWVANATYTTTFGGFGLSAAKSGGGALLYVTSGNGATAANKVMQLTDAAGEFVNPRWSPDGTKIMCARRLGDMNVVVFSAPR